MENAAYVSAVKIKRSALRNPYRYKQTISQSVASAGYEFVDKSSDLSHRWTIPASSPFYAILRVRPKKEKSNVI
ncbi:MAG: hypothetical protein KGL39_56160 [Patescibacteria group bacterium]|nr:hypothetical protein [Patescibacteria group bacterium]